MSKIFKAFWLLYTMSLFVAYIFHKIDFELAVMNLLVCSVNMSFWNEANENV